MNDLGHGIDAEKFRNSYSSILQTRQRKYPLAEVFCVSLADRDTRLKYLTNKQIDAMCSAIVSAGSKFHYVDLFNSILNNDCYIENSLEDGLHPSASGMKIIANIIKDAL